MYDTSDLLAKSSSLKSVILSSFIYKVSYSNVYTETIFDNDIFSGELAWDRNNSVIDYYSFKCSSDCLAIK